MHCHCGTNNRAPRWTFTDPCKPEVRPGAREESASPAWLAAPAMNARGFTSATTVSGIPDFIFVHLEDVILYLFGQIMHLGASYRANLQME